MYKINFHGAADCDTLTFNPSYYASVMIYDNTTMAGRWQPILVTVKRLHILDFGIKPQTLHVILCWLGGGFQFHVLVKIFVYGFINENNNKFI